jgi:hypothetical protein
VLQALPASKQQGMYLVDASALIAHMSGTAKGVADALLINLQQQTGLLAANTLKHWQVARCTSLVQQHVMVTQLIWRPPMFQRVAWVELQVQPISSNRCYIHGFMALGCELHLLEAHDHQTAVSL